MIKADFSSWEKKITSGNSFEVPEELRTWLRRWKRLYLNGNWSDGASGETFRTFNPATAEELSEVCLAKREDVDRAVISARQAFDSGVWSKISVRERGDFLKKISDLILEHRVPLAILESLDTGKPIRESLEGDIPRAALNFKFFADYGVKQEESQIFEDAGYLHRFCREPLGVIALITPWNLPLYLETWKVAPALMMGNSVVLKPSELTPLTASYFAELVHSLNLPAGVFNLVQGLGEASTGEYLVSHAGVDAISFTGETSTGRAIMKAASVGPTRVSFELGGKSAAIVCEDAPWDLLLKKSLQAAFRNQGEICLAVPRIYIAQSKYEAFVEAFVEQAKAIRVGDPLDFKTEMGALISEEHWKKVKSYMSRVDPPSKILCGGDRPPELTKGNFFSPTVITGIDSTHIITREELFGPVVAIYPFESEEQAIREANATSYGLSSCVWTLDKARAQRIATALHTGLVWINSWLVRDLRVPFGGQKRSGLGREGGDFSLDFYSDWKSVCYPKELG